MLDADNVRSIALSFPETTEKERWGHPTFDVAGKMFVTVPDDETSFAVRCPRFDREELIAAEPHKFWVPNTRPPRPGYGSGWLNWRIGKSSAIFCSTPGAKPRPAD